MSVQSQFAPASLPQWIQAIAQIITLMVSIAAFAVAYATYRRGSPAARLLNTQSQQRATPTKAIRIRDILCLFTIRDFWPPLVIFAISLWSLFSQALSTESVTRFGVLLTVLSGSLALICLIWLTFRAWFYFAALKVHKEMDERFKQ